MDLEGLYNAMVEARPNAGDVVYVERRGEEYGLKLTPVGGGLEMDWADATPDAWVFWTGAWPDDDDPARQRATFDDLIEEMETVAGGSPDRCRWSADDPWPRGH